MSFWYYTPDNKPLESMYSGEAGLGEIWSAATSQQKLVENSNAALEALTRAYDARIKAVKDATGEETTNPMRTDLRTGTFEARPNPTYSLETGNEPRQARIDAAVSGFNTWLSDVAKRHPDQASIIAPERPVEKDAAELARHADETLAKAMASRDGIGKWLAAFAGSAIGSLSDPLQVVGLMVGGGAGTARTAAGRIVTTTLTEAAANAAMEAVIQPQVQAWRKQVGLPNGLNEAMQNVAFAGLFGGVVGGAGGAAAEGVRVLSRLREAAPEDIARNIAVTHEVKPELRDALTGDTAKAAELLAPVRDALPAETRGAIDALTADRTFAEAAPASAFPLTHENNLNRAIQSAIDNQPWTPEVDMAQVARIAEQLQPDAPRAPVTEQTLQQFLIRQGGVQDYKGELAAIGVANASERFSGRLVRDTGLTLDNARLAAAEAGYFNHLYGTPDIAAEKSTIRDLLDTLDQGARASAPTEVNARAHVENLVHDLVAHAGPGIDDASVMRAADLTISEGLTPQAAMDRVLIEKDQAAGIARPERGATRPEAATVDTTRGGLDDPGQPLDDTFFAEADLEGLSKTQDIPFFDDGQTLKPDELMAELQRYDDLTALVEACRA